MEKLSDNITMRAATYSSTALVNNIKNVPNEKQLENMRLLAENVFEPLRKGLGDRPIFISSFYRSAQLNLIIGGAIQSQHMANKGAAMDIDNDINKNGATNAEIFNYIADYLDYDQLIWEYGTNQNPDWVHVSYNIGKNRKQKLRITDRGASLII